MQESVVLSILLLICLGQVHACSRGPLSGVIYYGCVAPLGYFSVWTFGTWEPHLLCGAILIAWPLFARQAQVPGVSLRGHPLVWFVAYVLAATVIGSQFWPYDAIMGRSIAYSVLRAPVRMIGFFIMIGGAWRIGEAMSQPGAFRQARATWLFVGAMLCLYGVYQWQAYAHSLPMTGIRRPATDATFEDGGEQFAAYSMDGTYVFRPCSLIGEPKHLGSLCVFWLLIIVAEMFGGQRREIVWPAALLVPLALWLTASTSAWVSAALATCWSGYVIFKIRRLETGGILFILAVLFLMVVLLPILPARTLSQIDDVFRLRVVQRLEDPLNDLPEVLTKDVFYERPALMITGTGLGGISFYIANAIGGSPVVLFPNNGVLGLLSDCGLIGVLLLLIVLRPALLRIFRATAHEDVEAQLLALVGLGMVIQCLIFPGEILWSMAIGFSLGAGFHQRQAQ